MSGGRFNYENDSLMSEMFDFLEEGDPIPNVLEDREISELTYDLLTLIHDYDWYASGDTGKQDYLKAKKAFKKKWFGTNRGLRIKRIVDDAVEHTREELYETFDLKEQDHENR